MIEVYQFALSGNCHKVRMLLSLNLPPHHQHIGRQNEQKSPEFLAMNPLAKCPFWWMAMLC